MASKQTSQLAISRLSSGRQSVGGVTDVSRANSRGRGANAPQLARSYSDGNMPRARSLSATRSMASLDVDAPITRSSGVAQVNSRVVSKVGTQQTNQQRLSSNTGRQSLGSSQSAAGSSLRSSGVYVSQLDDVDDEEHKSGSWSWAQTGDGGTGHKGVGVSSAQSQDGRGQQRHDELALLMKELVSVRSHLSQRAREEEASRRAVEGEVDALQVLRHQEAKAFSAERMQLAAHFQELMQQVREVQSASSSETRSLLSQLSSTSEAASVREGSYVAQVSEQGATIEAQAQQIAHLRLLALGGSDEREGAATAVILQTALQEALQVRDAEVRRLQAELTALRASWDTVLAAQQAQEGTWSEASREELRLLRSRASAADSRVDELHAALSSCQASAHAMTAAAEREKQERRAQAVAAQQAAEAHAASLQAALASCQSELALARQERDAAVADLSATRAQHSAEQEGKDKALQALEQALQSLTASTAHSAELSDRQLAGAREAAGEARAEAGSARKALLDALSRHAAVEQALRRDVAQAHDLADAAASARESAELQYSSQLQALAGRLAEVEAAADRTQGEMAGVIQDLRVALEAAEAGLAKQAQEAAASYKSAEAGWRELLDTYSNRCGTLLQQVGEAESLLAQEREAAAARESSLRATLASTRLEAEHVAKGWSARVASSESRVAQLEESLRAMTARLHATAAIRGKLGLEVAQAGAGPTPGAHSTPARSTALASSSSSSAAVVLSPPSPSAYAPPATFTDAFVEGVMAPGAAGGSSARRSSMGIVGVGAEARRLSLGGSTSALPLPPPPSSSFPLPGHTAPAAAGGGGLRSRSASFTGAPFEPSAGPLQPPALPAPLADAVRTLGACALVQAWAHNRSAAVQAYTALSTAVDQSSERIKSALAPSESTRAGLAKEVAGLRQSLADTAAGRAEARAALDALKSEAEAKHSQEEEWTSNARAALSATNAALQSALVAAQAASAACVAQRRAETEGVLDLHAATTAQLSAMQTSNDELRASLTALTQRGQKALESLSASHLSTQAVEERAAGQAALLAAQAAQGQAKEAAAREELEALQQKLASLQRTSEADCSTMRTLVGEAKAVARAACASRDAAGGMQAQQVRLLQGEVERLSSAALQAATVSSAASEAVRARYQAWCEGRELGPGGYKQLLGACRQEMQAHVEASEAKAAAFRQMVDAVEAALRAMRGAEAARDAANRSGADVSSRLVQHARAACATLAARLQGATERSQAEIDALRQQLAGTDAQAAARLPVLVNRAHKLLSEASTSGGGLAAQDRVLLQSLLERLGGGGERPGRAGASSSNGSVADLAFTELSTLQRQADFLTRQLSQAQADRGREADRYAGELLKVQGLVDAVRHAYQQATAAVHASSSSVVSATPSTTSNAQAQAGSSSALAPAVAAGGGGGVGRGLGLSSPDIARGTSGLTTGSASYSEVGLSSPFDAAPHAYSTGSKAPGATSNPLLSSLRVGAATKGQHSTGSASSSSSSGSGDSLPGASVHVVSIDLVEGMLSGGDDSVLLLPPPPPPAPSAGGAGAGGGQQGTGAVGARAVLEDLASPTGPAPSMSPLPYHSSTTSVVKQGEGSSSSISTTSSSTAEGLGKRVSLGGVPLLGETGSLPPPPPPVHTSMLGQSLGGQSIGQMDLNISSTTAGLDLSGTVRLDSSGTGLGGAAGAFLSP